MKRGDPADRAQSVKNQNLDNELSAIEEALESQELWNNKTDEKKIGEDVGIQYKTDQYNPDTEYDCNLSEPVV